MSSRKIHQAPTFQEIETSKELERVVLEIHKFRPSVEVSVEHHPFIARGRMIDWNPAKKLLTVEWKTIPEEFRASSALRTGLRAFFKVSLFSMQILFKCELIRRLPDGTYQYRIPAKIYKNQKRTALRVPLPKGKGLLRTPKGSFAILDLSMAGARIDISLSESKKLHQVENCSLILDGRKFTPPAFGVTLTSLYDELAGCRFHGLNEGIHVEIKQFLIEALHDFFKKGVSR